MQMALGVTERGPGGSGLRAACVMLAFLSNLWTVHVIWISSGGALYLKPMRRDGGTDGYICLLILDVPVLKVLS
jgi:hypothetical protein